jgi:hypothetical protein
MPRGRPPSPAAASVVKLLRTTALSPATIAGQTGMSVPSVTRYARQLAAEGFVRPGEASDQRIAETRATLLRLAGERTLDGPSWRQVVADRLDISPAAVSKAYRKGVSLATRERWLRTVYAPPSK